jgi:hypothetical protein
MKIRTYIKFIFLFTCLTCMQAGEIFGQVLINTRWKAIGNLAIAAKNQGIDTLMISFLPNDRMEFRYIIGSTANTSYGLWYQLAPGYLRFRDTSNSGFSSLCDPDDDAYVQYTIDTGVMHFANMQDSCGVRGAIFTDSKWAIVDNNVSRIAELDKSGPVRIYPNPGAGSFHIDFKGRGADKFDINIYNLSGQLVFSLKDISADRQEIAITSLPEGIYFARIESGSGIPLVARLQVQY